MFKNFAAVAGLRSYQLLIASYAVSGLGTYASQLALMAKIYALTDSPLYLGGLPAVQALAAMAVGPLAGVMTDRLNRRAILIVSNLLAAGVIALPIWFGELWQLYLIAALLAVFTRIFGVAEMALEPNLVPKELLEAANSIRSAIRTGLMLVGPGLGGAIAGWISFGAAFGVDTLSYVVAGLLLLGVRAPTREKGGADSESTEREPILRSLREGLVLVWQVPLIRLLLLLQLVLYFTLGGQGPLFYVFVAEELNRGVAEVGLLFSVLGVGSLVGTFLVVPISRRLGRLTSVMVVLAVDGVALAVFSLVRQFEVSLVCMGVMGLISTVFVVNVRTLLQSRVPDEIRGRVYGIVGTFTDPVSVLSLGICTSLATRFSAMLVLLGCAALELVTATVSLAVPGSRKLRALADDGDDDITAKDQQGDAEEQRKD